MDFNDTPEEAAFRAEARAWLAANAEPRDAVHSLLINQETGDFSAAFEQAKAWQARKFDGGFGAIYSPPTWAGAAGSRSAPINLRRERPPSNFPPPTTS